MNISIACVVIECLCGNRPSMQKSTLVLLVLLYSACMVIDEHAETNIIIACVVIECLCGYRLSMQKLTLVLLV